MPQPDAIVSCARGWLGTPYHHQGSVRGAGCDCLGLIRGVWRALYGPEPETMPPYSRDWGNATGSETLIAAACRHLVPLDSVGDARPGDVLVFRMRDKGVAKHAGILSALPDATLPYRPSAYLRAGLLERELSAVPCSSSGYEPFSARDPRACPGGPRLGDDAQPFVDARNRFISATASLLERTSGHDEGGGVGAGARGTRPGRPSRLAALAPQDDGRASKDGRAPHHDDAHEGPQMIHAQEGLGVVEIPLASGGAVARWLRFGFRATTNIVIARLDRAIQ
ncbi:hypothetical protein [Methyloceanibacter methanicus]|uniref:hypothetical protein n=1 Tax=Methyloceanibacter methanicus TaxID=1774968 RepID=UPI000849B235|nr:hypothetical protein [Methyloceanibacter methanicus]